MGAAAHRIAGIGGADILIVAISHGQGFAFTRDAGVLRSAGITVVAFPGKGIMLASSQVIAEVFGARIAVVAIKLESWLACTLRTVVI